MVKDNIILLENLVKSADLSIFLPSIKFHYSARGHSFKFIGFVEKNL